MSNTATILKDIETLLKTNTIENKKQAHKLYKANKLLIDTYIAENNKGFLRINGASFSGYNLMFLALLGEGAGTYGTYKQLKEKGYSNKGQKGVQLLMPIFEYVKKANKSENENSEGDLKGFKSYYVFKLNETNKIEKTI